ncbi:type VII secretion protein EccCa [Streptomyces bambusae]|uniref:type VII secretion protein EccCa n=1 Tax=Streptomyces bambusae TaxID=1550616 RepID=UPI001CFF91EC|nr:type VII secretion protein EccCa [Streptomyces bambusae]MCB5169958.1 type VII secretion protein EccCa [Streptomyces bambusae]
MSHVVVKRPPRVLPPEVPSEEVRLQAPPELPRGQREGVLLQLLPMLGMGSSSVFFFLSPQPFMRVMGFLMLAATAALAVAQAVRHRRGTDGQLADARRDYLAHLGRARRRVRAAARMQREAQLHLHPDPGQLWAVVTEGARVWERRSGDADFGQVRVGLGAQRPAVPVVAPEAAPAELTEPLAAGALRRFLAAHAQVEELPVAVSLRAFRKVSVSGGPEPARGAVRALLAQLVVLHSPDDVVVAVLAAPGAAEAAWDWVKWLPHARAAGCDGAGPRRLFGTDPAAVDRLLAPWLEGRPRFDREAPAVPDRPHVVVVVEAGGGVPAAGVWPGEGVQGVTVVECRADAETAGGVGPGRLAVAVGAGVMRLEPGGGVAYEGVPDALSPAAAEALARQLAPLRTGGTGAEDGTVGAADFAGLLELGDPAGVDVAQAWRPRPAGDRLRVPIGVGEDGAAVLLDLKETAEEGMGPHGLCVGATGSGKSELLRTLVLGLAVTHGSEALNFVLADFKGGATFAGLAGLPHVAAVITNLEDDLTLVDRMGDALRGELRRRQEVLRAAGHCASVRDHERARAAGAPLEPLPSLVVVVDEFSELLAAKPEFIDIFLQIGRIGRSLGVHLLLASQRLEEGRLRGLETYLSYRIGLRTFSAAESRTALGVPDAFHLPAVPGSGYLAHGSGELVRFSAAYVSGAYRAGGVGAEPTGGAGGAGVLPRAVLFTAAEVPGPEVPGPEGEKARGAEEAAEPAAAPGAAYRGAESVLDVVVRRLAGEGPGARAVWLPPLGEAPSLDGLLAEVPAAGGLVVPLGLVDRPFEQRREVLCRDFSGAGGHLLVVGGPQSGKSVLLRSLVCAFALTHAPGDVQFYGVDFGGGALAAVAGLPHVGGVASRLEPERVRRTVAEVAGVLARREEWFRAHGVESMADLRRRRAASADGATGDAVGETVAGGLGDGFGNGFGDGFGDVFLLVDGWGAFRAAHEDLEPVVADLAARGLGYGVHVVLTASRHMEVRPALRDQVPGRLELRLGDPMDSDFDRRVAAAVPQGVPGRGQVPEGLHFIAAVPRADGRAGAADLAAATAALVASVRRARPGPGAPEVRLLPHLLPADRLPKGSEEPGLGIALGVGEDALQPVFADFDTDPFFLVFGEGGSGKTALLRLVAKQLTERHGPEEARIVVGDPRRTLLEAVPPSHLLEYAATGAELEMHLEAVAALMRKRAPGPEVTPRQLRERSWWTGPRLFVLVDDYELAAAGSGSPAAGLADLLPYARDVGVRFVVARSSAGAARGAYDPFLMRLRELGAAGAVLSGDRGEGELLGGVRAAPLPPGRGVLVARGRAGRLVQFGWLPEEWAGKYDA